MRKAKLLLLLTIIFSLIGSTYAFKAQRIGRWGYIRAEDETSCTVLLTGAIFIAVVPGQPTIANTFATLVKGPCTDVHDIYTSA